jgi:hypothetical protein
MTAPPCVVRLVPRRDLRPMFLKQIVVHWSEVGSARATASEIAARWSLDSSTCEQLLAELVDRRSLLLREDGGYDLAEAECRARPSPQVA